MAEDTKMPAVPSVDMDTDLDSVRVPNEIAEARHRYSAEGQKLMFHIATQVAHLVMEDGESLTTKILKVPYSLVKKVAGIDGEYNTYRTLRGKKVPWKTRTENERVEDALNELVDNTLDAYIPQKNGTIERYHGGYVGWIMYDESNYIAKIQLADPLVPLYVRLSKYARLNTHTLDKFRSGYTLRLYPLLMEFNNPKNKNAKGYWPRRLEMQQLRDYLEMSDKEYPNGGNFKKRVVDKAIDEINKLSDIKVHCTVEYGARKAIKAFMFMCVLKSDISAAPKVIDQKAILWTDDDKHRYKELTGELFRKYKSDQKYAKLPDAAIMEGVELEAREIIEKETGRMMK